MPSTPTIAGRPADESRSRRARHDAASAFHAWPFLVCEAAVSGAAGWFGGFVVASDVQPFVQVLAAVGFGALGALVPMAAVLATKIAAAPARQRDEARAALAASLRPESVSLADRVHGLAVEGARLIERSERDPEWGHSAMSSGAQDWAAKATALIRDDSPRYLPVFHSFQAGDPLQGNIMSPSGMRAQRRWILANQVAGLRDVETRLRARAGEDIGTETTRWFLFKDALLEAERVREELQEDPRRETALRWAFEYERLIRAALPPESAQPMLEDGDFDPNLYSFAVEPERQQEANDPELKRALIKPAMRIADISHRPGQVPLNETFDPKDWLGRFEDLRNRRQL